MRSPGRREAHLLSARSRVTRDLAAFADQRLLFAAGQAGGSGPA